MRMITWQYEKTTNYFTYDNMGKIFTGFEKYHFVWKFSITCGALWDENMYM